MPQNNNSPSNNPFLIKEFQSFLVARLFFVFAVRMLFTTISYQIFLLTKQTYFIGLAGLFEFIPALLAAFFAGAYIDKHNKKNVLVYGYLAYLLCGLVLIFFSTNFCSSTFTTNTILYVLYGVMFATGLIRSFVGPASNSMIAAIVGLNALPKATSYNSTIWLLSSAVGHILAGVIIAAISLTGAYIAIVICIIIALSASTFIKSKPPELSQRAEPILQSIKQGFSFVWQQKNLLGVMSLDLFVVLFGGAVAFIPEVNELILNAGATGFGFLNAAIDLGGLLSIALLIIFPIKAKQGLKMLIAVFGFGICIIIFGLSKQYWLSFLALFIAGVFDGFSVVVRGTIMQLTTPNHLRGRVSGINSIFINSSNEFGAYESGITSRFMGTVPAIVFGGVISLIIVIITYIKFPALKKMEY
jgi:MFS family permease